jgi:stearoyl-CoA desaturase (delta-9 desaturase)
MAFIDNILQVPSYGWKNDRGELVVPTLKQLFTEAFSRINIFKTRKNWISLISWVMAACLFPFFIVFIVHYFSLKLLGAFILYSMIIMSTHGTIWFHRYCTHKAYKFSPSIGALLRKTWFSAPFRKKFTWYRTMCIMLSPTSPAIRTTQRVVLCIACYRTVNHQSIAKGFERS